MAWCDDYIRKLKGPDFCETTLNEKLKKFVTDMNIKLQQNGIMENIVLDTQKRSIIFPDCKIKFSCDNDKYSFIRIKSNNESAIEQSIDVIWIQNNYSVKPGINAKSMQAKSYDTIEQDTIEYVFMNLLL